MYGDPGIVSMIIAVVVGSVVAIPTYLYLMRKRIGDWINAKRNKKRPG